MCIVQTSLRTSQLWKWTFAQDSQCSARFVRNFITKVTDGTTLNTIASEVAYHSTIIPANGFPPRFTFTMSSSTLYRSPSTKSNFHPRGLGDLDDLSGRNKQWKGILGAVQASEVVVGAGFLLFRCTSHSDLLVECVRNGLVQVLISRTRSTLYPRLKGTLILA